MDTEEVIKYTKWLRENLRVEKVDNKLVWVSVLKDETRWSYHTDEWLINEFQKLQIEKDHEK